MLKDLENIFIIPEKTASGYNFGEMPKKITYEESKVVVYGVPLDITTSFGRGTHRGPETIRTTSALQIETFLLDKGYDIHDKAKIFDLGDLKIIKNNKTNIEKIIDDINIKLPQVNQLIISQNKIPLILGGEHTLTYFSIQSFVNKKPLIIHFDAHRDMKPHYNGLEICHTTPFYHIIEKKFVEGKDIIQIGIRQTDMQENEIAKKNNIKTFNAWQVHYEFNKLLNYITKITKNRNIYISFDIDVYDICYVPCTGTPEPFGLTPFQIYEIIKSINESANLIGMDLVEVALKNNDYREGTLATQTIYRILSKLVNR